MPESAAAVAANARLNGLDQVHVHGVAVGGHAGQQTLHVRDAHSWSHLADRGDHGVIRERLPVAVVCLDEEIAAGRLSPPDVIKVDVEGSEGAVLRGLTETLRRHRPWLFASCMRPTMRSRSCCAPPATRWRTSMEQPRSKPPA